MQLNWHIHASVDARPWSNLWLSHTGVFSVLWRGRLRVVEDLGYIQDGSVAASDARIVNVWPALGGRAGPKKQQGHQPCKAVDNLHRIRTVIVVQPRQSHDC